MSLLPHKRYTTTKVKKAKVVYTTTARSVTAGRSGDLLTIPSNSYCSQQNKIMVFVSQREVYALDWCAESAGFVRVQSLNTINGSGDALLMTNLSLSVTVEVTCRAHSTTVQPVKKKVSFGWSSSWHYCTLLQHSSCRYAIRWVNTYNPAQTRNELEWAGVSKTACICISPLLC